MSVADLLFSSTCAEWRRPARSAIFRRWLFLEYNAAAANHGRDVVQMTTSRKRTFWEVFVEVDGLGMRTKLAEVDGITLELCGKLGDVKRVEGNAMREVFASVSSVDLEGLVRERSGSTECGSALLELQRRGADLEALAIRVLAALGDNAPQERERREFEKDNAKTRSKR